MSIGIIGSARMGQMLAGLAVKAGQDVVISNRRGPDSLADLTTSLGPQAKAGTTVEAAACDIVFLAVPWWTVADCLSDLPLTGRILVDTTNAFASYDPFTMADLGGRVSSKIVADLVPSAHVVKAFNTAKAESFASDHTAELGSTVVFLSGDHAPSKEAIASLVTSWGLVPIDLGDLETGGRLQQAGGPIAGNPFIRVQ